MSIAKTFCILATFLITMTVCFQSYAQDTAKQPSDKPELQTIKLLAPDFSRGVLLMQALKDRKSARHFSSQPLSDELLSNLLWAASGVNRPDGKRTAPSARNWQEITIYVAMSNGVYRYNAANHTLEPYMAEDIREFTGIQEFTQIAPVNLIYVADFSKMDKALQSDTDVNMFYPATDTGFISQNVYLFCASEGLATVVLGWVDKPELEKRLKLPKTERVILTQPVGHTQ
ncbi:MAG: SagB/ThcOx family dehydrogenase [Candidatus Auribacterota bacterium]|jgi:SagB-type dehydrogenase family enzyme|nr:SagB/ThcOx family dehydrogenase [Candidatus Auribacterota bacterium]